VKAFSLTATILFATFFYLLFEKKNIENDFIYEIPKGASINSVLTDLSKLKVIENPYLLNLYLYAFKKNHHIKAGEYSLNDSDTSVSIFDKFINGTIYYRNITFIEGMNFRELMKVLDQSYGLINDLENKPEINILISLKLKDVSVEGLFYPETYFYTKYDTYSEILKRANIQFNQKIKILWEERMANYPLKDINEALTLASMVEKEGVEKKEIAGVFLNRLDIGMRLQSDPTVIFAMAEKFNGNITSKDLEKNHSYNTYRIDGLPPGPIGLVSIDTFKAVLNPKTTNSLYFVSRGDGTHEFSDTLLSHNKAVRKYQQEKNDS